MTLVARRGRARRRPRPRVPIRHAGPRRVVRRRAPATSRCRSSATTTPASSCTGPARSSAVTSSTTTPRSTRPACPRRRPAPRSATSSGRSSTSSPATSTGRIGAEGFARVDFLMAGERILVSEINTIPGFTPISLFPTMPADGGYTFTDVCLRIVELALERHAARPASAPATGRPAAMTLRPRRRRAARRRSGRPSGARSGPLRSAERGRSGGPRLG